MIFHALHSDILDPERFTFPFCYEPHPLCVEAARAVCSYIAGDEEIKRDADRGKMFGVLIVRDKDGRRGFLAAYSGLLAGRNDWEFFVPPVFDSQQPDGYFKSHEAEITAVNKEIDSLEHDSGYMELVRRREECRLELITSVSDYKSKMQAAKQKRDEKRRCAGGVTATEEAEMVRESQFMKAELRRIRKRCEARLAVADSEAKAFAARIRLLKDKRKEMSDALQRWLFEQYVMLNGCGERRSLCSIFADTGMPVPPAGAGDCCAPKLLQYAYLNGMHPVCMAEFWWGMSPKSEVRHHLRYYPACRGKCGPILGYMLQGLDVDTDPQETDEELQPEIVYEDEWLAVVCKPAGMLSVPGKSGRRSVLSVLRDKYPDADGPMIVHRLDMGTSGLMVVAKTKYVHERLQAQFMRREIRKRYVALLEGVLPPGKGMVSLPMRADHLDRPLQKVDYNNGKPAVTEYAVLGAEGGHSRVVLFPHTGRTHQLRVHCAHTGGLGMPILGDELYGHGAARLYLHAEAITFIHPVLSKEFTFERKADF